MNYENLGARIAENGAWNQKIWALEAFRGKMVFSRRFKGNFGFFGVVGGSWHKRQGLLQNWGFFRDFCGILEGLNWFRTYS
jgi:hypothetical protein